MESMRIDVYGTPVHYWHPPMRGHTRGMWSFRNPAIELRLDFEPGYKPLPFVLRAKLGNHDISERVAWFKTFDEARAVMWRMFVDHTIAAGLPEPVWYSRRTPHPLAK